MTSVSSLPLPNPSVLFQRQHPPSPDTTGYLFFSLILLAALAVDKGQIVSRLSAASILGCIFLEKIVAIFRIPYYELFVPVYYFLLVHTLLFFAHTFTYNSHYYLFWKDNN